ncbi:hypothetical protein BD324DRAFT_651424 [Kockovaella imperatae]|uniref:Uncharacterized protein n=1 Tax=Kockovaella imperatae TaxID=4999 RepID=A0A1Y1UFW3_9TREE|nr:hypothetical protein BD324DRAFT_651424 [Kockovaella imperatae]ORX36951.1 hypothetical protein BD324DRAFT_651424 [Kockovaella imperatae]
MSTPASPTLSISSTPLASFQHASVSTPSIGAGSGSMSTAPHTAGGQHRRQNGGIPPPPPAYSTVHSPTRSSSLNRLQPRSTPPPPSSASSSHTPALSSTPVPPTDPPQTPLSTSSTASSYSRRVWVPTPNVPMRLQDRHHVHRVSPLTGQDEERNRWLSEDEGANSGVEGGSSRRRRRRQRSIPDQSACHDEPSNTHIPPGLPAASLDLRRPAFDARDRIKNQIAASSSPSTSPKPAANRSSRPIIRRAMSHEPQVSRSLTPATPIGAVDVTVGAFPPQIQDIVPTPGSPVRRFSVETKISPSARGSLQSAELVASTSGVQQTTESDGDDLMSERERRRAARHSTLETLQRILSWRVLHLPLRTRY